MVSQFMHHLIGGAYGATLGNHAVTQPNGVLHMATLKQTASKTKAETSKEAIRKAAGLAPVTNEPTHKDTATKVHNPDAPASPFPVTVSGDLGEFKQGEVLTDRNKIVDYFILVLNEGAKEPTRLTRAQIWEGIVHMRKESDSELSPDDFEVVVTEYLETLKTVYEPLSEEQLLSIVEKSDHAAAAKKFGEMADDALQDSVEKGVEGKKLWNSSPMMAEKHLVRLYGEKVLDTWPVVNSRKTGKGDGKDTIPMESNEKADYFLGDIGNGKQEVVSWIKLFALSMPHLIVPRQRLKLATELANNAAIQETLIPDEWKEYVGNKPSMLGIKAQIAGDITDFVNRMVMAVSVYQAKKQIEEHLTNFEDVTKNVGWEYVNGKEPEELLKSRKPIQMLSMRKDGKWMASDAPVALSVFVRYGRKAKECMKQGGGFAKLKDLSKIVKKPEPVAGPGAAATPVVMIQNVDQFETNIEQSFRYIEEHYEMIRLRLTDPKRNKHIAFWLYTLANKMQSFANDKNIAALYSLYDKEMGEVAASQAETEAKRKAEKEAADKEAADKLAAENAKKKGTLKQSVAA